MNRIVLSMLVLLQIMWSSCSEDEPINETGTASLIVKVVHVDGTSVKDATVNLYGSQLDFQNETNMITSLKTDELGEAYFKELELKQYWFVVLFNEYSNATSISTTGRALNKDERLEKTTQLRK
ncbi:MAG: hypothetical protein ACPGLV_09060 [Bacteroidia bacterium]